MPSSLFLAGVSVQTIRDSPAAFTTGCCIIVASRSSCCLCSCGYHDKLCLWDFNLQEASRLSTHGMLFTICADLHIFLLCSWLPTNLTIKLFHVVSTVLWKLHSQWWAANVCVIGMKLQQHWARQKDQIVTIRISISRYTRKDSSRRQSVDGQIGQIALSLKHIEIRWNQGRGSRSLAWFRPPRWSTPDMATGDGDGGAARARAAAYHYLILFSSIFILFLFIFTRHCTADACSGHFWMPDACCPVC